MELRVPRQKIDLSDAHLGLDFPEIENRVREIAKEFIEGVFENNLRLAVDEAEGGEKCVVLWSSLEDGIETPIAVIPVDELFDEYVERRKHEGTIATKKD